MNIESHPDANGRFKQDVCEVRDILINLSDHPDASVFACIYNT